MSKLQLAFIAFSVKNENVKTSKCILSAESRPGEPIIICRKPSFHRLRSHSAGSKWSKDSLFGKDTFGSVGPILATKLTPVDRKWVRVWKWQQTDHRGDQNVYSTESRCPLVRLHYSGSSTLGDQWAVSVVPGDNSSSSKFSSWEPLTIIDAKDLQRESFSLQVRTYRWQ